MKKIIAVILILFLACKDDEPTPQQQQTDQGCMTAINSHGNRMFLRCCTQKEFAAGSNVSLGGYAGWSNYTHHEWEKCSECQ